MRVIYIYICTEQNQIYTHMINNNEFEKIMSKITPQILVIYGYLIKKADNYIQLLNISYIISDNLQSIID